MQRWSRITRPIPDVLLSLFFAAAAFSPLVPADVRLELFFVLVAEGGFLMMQATLVDIATRLRKRPPVWAIVLIAGVVLLFSGQALDVLRLAWGRGAVVFIPLVFSLVERGSVLWHLPTRSRAEKIAARALIANRITTGLALLVLFVLSLIAAMVFDAAFDWAPLAAGAIYFAVAALDDWRVRGARFAAKPRVLFGFDPIHIEYLEPV